MQQLLLLLVPVRHVPMHSGAAAVTAKQPASQQRCIVPAAALLDAAAATLCTMAARLHVKPASSADYSCNACCAALADGCNVCSSLHCSCSVSLQLYWMLSPAPN